MLTLLTWLLITIGALLLLGAAAWCVFLAVRIVHYTLATLLLPFGINLFPAP